MVRPPAFPALLWRAAQAVAAGRVALGLAALAWPAVPARPWVGAAADDLAARVFGRALGARDLALGLGALVALQHAACGSGPAGGRIAAGPGSPRARSAADPGSARARAAADPGSARAWVAAGALCDALDVVASLSSWRDLPRTSRWLVAATAGGAALAGAAGALTMRPGRHDSAV